MFQIIFLMIRENCPQNTSNPLSKLTINFENLHEALTYPNGIVRGKTLQKLDTNANSIVALGFFGFGSSL